MVFARTFRIGQYSTILAIIVLSFCFLFTSKTTAIPGGESMNWDQFVLDYTDKDGDGENDTFLSLDPFDKVTINDLVVRSRNHDYGSLEFSEIILESNPEPLVFGKTLGSSIIPGDRILVDITVIEGNESDGEPCETYEVNSVWYFEERDNENGDTWINSDQHIPWFRWIIMVVPLIIVCLIIYVLLIRQKKKKNDISSNKIGKPKNR